MKIAPKKAKAVEQQIVRKKLEKVIHANIEDTIRAAASHETNFKVSFRCFV